MAPVLYAIAVLAGVAYFTYCIELGIKHGMTFSHGLIDFVVLFNPIDERVGVLRARAGLGAHVLRGLFRVMIQRFDPEDAGRELEDDAGPAAPPVAGGRVAGSSWPRSVDGANIQSLDACITACAWARRSPRKAIPIV